MHINYNYILVYPAFGCLYNIKISEKEKKHEEKSIIKDFGNVARHSNSFRRSSIERFGCKY